MVMYREFLGCVQAAWLWGQTPRPLFFRLKPEDRARVLVALVGLVILGIVLVLLVSWGARVTRRYMRRAPSSERPPWDRLEDDWARKPLYQDADTSGRGADEPSD
jgi:hypothetical protein